MYQGATFQPTVTVTQNGSPFDFTDYTAAMRIVNGENTTILLLGTADSTIVLSENVIAFNVANTVTAALAPGTYNYDLLVTAPDTTVTPILAGFVRVVGSPTGGS